VSEAYACTPGITDIALSLAASEPVAYRLVAFIFEVNEWWWWRWWWWWWWWWW